MTTQFAGGKLRPRVGRRAESKPSVGVPGSVLSTVTPKPLTRDALCQLMRVPFSSQQLDAITAPLEPAVVVAGAGSGKTTVMAARVVWLVAAGQVSPEAVLGLTFTNKAAAELRHRVAGALSAAALGGALAGSEARSDQEPSVLTYHAYAGQLLCEHGLRIGHEPDTVILTDASKFQLAEQAVRRHRAAIHHLTTSLSSVVRYVLQLDAQLADNLLTPDDVRTWQEAQRPRWHEAKQTAVVRNVLTTFACREELLDLVEDYRALKAERGVMDFSDALARSATLAEACPEVAKSERDRFRVVLLDEYQDTSVTQTRLLYALFGAGHPVTAVGDPCQAIYGWRGASASNLDAFPHQFAVHRRSKFEPAIRYPLNINRRSCRTVLDIANFLAQPLYAEHPGSRALQAPDGAQPGAVRAGLFETFDDELDFLASEISSERNERSGRRWSDIAVLVRDNTMGANVHDRLVDADIPVEVVGLSGLLDLPEVRDVVATLELLHDVTANAALLQLLTGPRWNVGPRDVALLGRRARELAAAHQFPPASLHEALDMAVEGTDPADAPSLLEALLDSGERRYSPAARQRFAELGAELRTLLRCVGDPLLDLVRRVIETIGVDVELAACRSRRAEARRHNLATFVDAVAAFAGTGSDASLAGLLAYLRAEDEYGDGLPLALPSQTDSVKVMTVHKAKGLEWEMVFVPGLTKDVFPTRRSRPRWTTVACEVPWPLRGDAADLPEVPEPSRAGLEKFTKACAEHQRQEERRLAYVAFTRARQTVVASGSWWGPRQIRSRGPSDFLKEVFTGLRLRGQTPDLVAPEPEAGAANPVDRRQRSSVWPADGSSAERVRRQASAELVANARTSGWQAAADSADQRLERQERARVDQWDTEIARLLEEASASATSEVVVAMPRSLSATTALRLRRDPAGLARELARPMPRQPSAAERFGTRFHAWVEAHVGQQQLLALDDVPGRADEALVGDAELRELADAFAAGPFGQRTPLQVEAPFTTVLGVQVIRGRIDAVYQTATGYLVVDWKTSAAETADPLQLALYRMAWGELTGSAEQQVQAAFYYVRSGHVVEPDNLPGRDELERMWSQVRSGVATSA